MRKLLPRNGHEGIEDIKGADLARFLITIMGGFVND
jgi:hypothetical protein